jgi:hypothetical protein
MKVLLSFIAGFLSTLIFHQLAQALLWWAGIAPFAPFSVVAHRAPLHLYFFLAETLVMKPQAIRSPELPVGSVMLSSAVA